MAERLNSEKKIENKNFNLKIGTTNKNNPLVVYVEGKTFISPNQEKETYNKDIYDMKNCLRKTIINELKNNRLFDNNFILDFQVAQSGINKGKKSFLFFQFLLRQQKENALTKMKEIKEKSSDTVNQIIKGLENSIYEHDFSIYRTKK